MRRGPEPGTGTRRSLRPPGAGLQQVQPRLQGCRVGSITDGPSAGQPPCHPDGPEPRGGVVLRLEQDSVALLSGCILITGVCPPGRR